MLKVLIISTITLLIALALLLFFPPVRDRFFGSKMWPFPTPWDVTASQITKLRQAARPGDIIVERNLHSWHWMLLAQFFTGSNWVHAAIVDRDRSIINMSKVVKREDLSTYLQKQSTDMRLVRPPYKDELSIENALAFARTKIGTKFDPEFEDQAANCTGLIASALKAGGVEIPSRRALFSKQIYSAADILHMSGGRVLWSSRDRNRKEDKEAETSARTF